MDEKWTLNALWIMFHDLINFELYILNYLKFQVKNQNLHGIKFAPFDFIIIY
jgi:hypothetical protein